MQLSDSTPALAVGGVRMRFGGIQALDDVSFQVERGGVTALIGPNGAGKTTLFNIVAGEVRPDGGTVTYEGRDITGWRPDRICEAGIARTFQNPRLFADLGIVENVVAARFSRTRASLIESVLGLPRARAEAKADHERARSLLRLAGLESFLGRMPTALSYGNQRRLELARALATEPRVLLMDEPAAGMASSAIDELLELIRSLTADGLTVLIVEHNMSVVLSIASTVIVLDNGAKIAEGRPAEVLREPAVIAAYVGSD